MRIPRYYATGQAPVARGPSPEDAIRKARAIQGVTSSISDPIAKYIEAKQTAKASTALASAESMVVGVVQEYQRGLYRDEEGNPKKPKSDEIIGTFDEMAGKALEAAKSMSKDKKTRAAIEAEMRTLLLNERAKMLEIEEKLFVDEQRSGTQIAVDGMTEAGAYAMAIGAVDRAFDSGILEQEEYNAWRHEILVEQAKAGFNELLANGSNGELLEAMETLPTDDLPLDQTERGAMAKTIINEIERREALANKATDEYGKSLYRNLLQKLGRNEPLSDRERRAAGQSDMTNAEYANLMESDRLLRTPGGRGDDAMVKLGFERELIGFGLDTDEDTQETLNDFHRRLNEAVSDETLLFDTAKQLLSDARQAVNLVNTNVTYKPGVDYIQRQVAMSQLDRTSLTLMGADIYSDEGIKLLTEAARDASELQVDLFRATQSGGAGFDALSHAQKLVADYWKRKEEER